MAKKRTTLLLEPSLVRAAQKALGAATATQAVEYGLQEVVKHHRRQALRRRLGTFDLDLDLAQLRRLRRRG
jgi:hypothetical protein